VIDEVTVEKSSVCAGEENLVRVKAHTTNGTDAHLHYVIAGRAGNPAPVRAYRSDDGPPEPLQVSVFGRGTVVTSAPVPAFRIKECGQVPLVVLSHRRLVNRGDEFDFGVTVVHPPAGFEPMRYEWRFGDGAASATSEPVARHSYANLEQKGLYSELLVEVEVIGKSRQRLRGRSALELLNRAEQVLLERGVVLIEAELTPRFPELDSQGTLHQTVRLFHHSRQAVRLERVLLERRYKKASVASPPQAEEPARVLGSSTIPEGRGIEVSFVIPKGREPDVLALTYTLAGDAGDKPARGAFSLIWPPEPPTRENHRPVTSPAFKAKIRAAQRLLGKPLVSAEEIWDLERRGAFQQPCTEATGCARETNEPIERPF